MMIVLTSHYEYRDAGHGLAMYCLPHHDRDGENDRDKAWMEATGFYANPQPMVWMWEGSMYSYIKIYWSGYRNW